METPNTLEELDTFVVRESGAITIALDDLQGEADEEQQRLTRYYEKRKAELLAPGSLLDAPSGWESREWWIL